MLNCNTRSLGRMHADQLEPGRWIPECQLIVQWMREDQSPVHLMHKVHLIGAKVPYNFFHLTLNPAWEGSGFIILIPPSVRFSCKISFRNHVLTTVFNGTCQYSNFKTSLTTQ